MPATHEDTIAALATPHGESAIALVRVSGGECRRLAGEICGGGPPPRTARHADYRDRAGALVDDVLATFYAGPASYTGEDSLEIACHGNPYIAQRVLEDLFARGCRSAEPGEFPGWPQLGGRTPIDALALIGQHLGIVGFDPAATR